MARNDTRKVLRKCYERILRTGPFHGYPGVTHHAQRYCITGCIVRHLRGVPSLKARFLCSFFKLPLQVIICLISKIMRFSKSDEMIYGHALFLPKNDNCY